MVYSLDIDYEYLQKVKNRRLIRYIEITILRAWFFSLLFYEPFFLILFPILYLHLLRMPDKIVGILVACTCSYLFVINPLFFIASFLTACLYAGLSDDYLHFSDNHHSCTSFLFSAGFPMLSAFIITSHIQPLWLAILVTELITLGSYFIFHSEKSLIYWLSKHPVGSYFLSWIASIWLRLSDFDFIRFFLMMDCSCFYGFFMNTVTFNHIVTRGRYKGMSLALKLAKYPYFYIPNCELEWDGLDIKKETLNHIIKDGPYEGHSVAFAITQRKESMTQDNFRLILSMIDKKTLNHIIPKGPYRGLSVAYNLSWMMWRKKQPDSRLVSAELLSLIDEKTLNHIIQHGDFQGQSVAFVLALGLYFTQKRLYEDYSQFINDYPNQILISMINKETLNHIIPKGYCKGLSLAYLLAKNTSFGSDILSYNNSRLGSMINQTALNHIITDCPLMGDDVGLSTAYWLSCAGSVDLFNLKSSITVETLNHPGKCEAYEGLSVAFWLAMRGAMIPKIDKGSKSVGTQLEQETLNRIIYAKDVVGLSVAYALAWHDSGLSQLSDYCKLGLKIDAKTLNFNSSIVLENNHSLAIALGKKEEGRAILTRDDYDLARKIINLPSILPNFVLPKCVLPYYHNPTLLYDFMTNMPDRRSDIINEAPDHVDRLKGICYLASSNKKLKSHHSCKKEVSELIMNDLDTCEQSIIIALCLFKKNDCHSGTKTTSAMP